MPIGTSYDPVQAIGQMAHLAGQGEYQRQQDELALRQAAMAQEDAQFQQQMQLRQQALIAEQQQQTWQANNRNQLLGWQRQNEVADRQQQQQFQAGMMGQRRQWDVADQKAVTDRMQGQAAFNSADQSGDALDQQIDTTLAEYEKQRKFLSPPGVRALDALQNEFHARRQVRDWGKPAAYATVMSDLATRVQRADLQKHLNPPPTMEQRILSGELQVTPYGLMGSDRSNAIRKVADLPDPHKEKREFIQKQQGVTYKRDDGVIVPAYNKDQIEELWNDQQSLLGRLSPEEEEIWSEIKAAKAAAGTSVSSPSNKPSPKTATNFPDYWSALPDKDKIPLYKDAEKAITPKGKDRDGRPPKPPTADQIMREVERRVRAMKGFGSAEHEKWEAFKKRAPQEAAELEAWAMEQTTTPAVTQASAPAIGEIYTAPDGTKRRRTQ